MDTPDKAAGLADSRVADAVNKDWLLASARSSQLSTDLRQYDLNWSSGEQSSSSSRCYGSIAPSQASARNPLLQLNDAGSASAPPPSESSWLVRHQFWPTRRHRDQILHDEADENEQPTNYVNRTYAINGHLYDNISYADAPLMSSISRKGPHDSQAHSTRGKQRLDDRRPFQRELCNGKFRIVLACFVLLGITLSNYSRNALSLAAVGMIASNALNRELVNIQATEPAVRINANIANKIQDVLDGSCPLGQQVAGGADQVDSSYLMSDNSMPDGPLLFDAATIQVPPSRGYERLAAAAAQSAKRKDELESEFKKSIRRRVASGQLVDWSPGEFGLISAAGSVGNLLIAIPLTRMGEIHGPKWIIFVASLGSTIQAAFMPMVSTSCSVTLVILFQVIFNGLTYGADCVAYTLFAHWLTRTEMAFFVSCLIICYQLGSMMSNFVTAKILSQSLDWSWCFYTPAIMCGAWALVWSLIGASEPRLSWLVSRAELDYLSRNSKIAQTLHEAHNDTSERKRQEDHSNATASSLSSSGSHPVSWSKLARDPNIWAVIAVKFALRWYFSAYLSLMPTYLSSVAHMSVDTIGTMSVAQSFIGIFSGILMGYLTKSLVTRRPFDMSLAATRKCCQSIVSFGLALSLVAFISYDCNQWVTIASLTVGGFCISFYVAAALQIPLDMSPTHCGLITSITNTLALGQALGAPVSGLILEAGPKVRSRWRIVWSLAIGMNTLAGLVFILLVDAKSCDYNKHPARGAKQDEEDVVRRNNAPASCSAAAISTGS